MNGGICFFLSLDTIRFESSWIEFISVLIFTIWDPSVPWFSCFSMQTMFALSIIVSSILFFINSVVVLQFYIIFIAVVVFHFLSTLRLHSFFVLFGSINSIKQLLVIVVDTRQHTYCFHVAVVFLIFLLNFVWISPEKSNDNVALLFFFGIFFVCWLKFSLTLRNLQRIVVVVFEMRRTLFRVGLADGAWCVLTVRWFVTN